jgi:hypothetical protein
MSVDTATVFYNNSVTITVGHSHTNTSVDTATLTVLFTLPTDNY